MGDVIQIAPRVSGHIVDLPIKDNRSSRPAMSSFRSIRARTRPPRTGQGELDGTSISSLRLASRSLPPRPRWRHRVTRSRKLQVASRKPSQSSQETERTTKRQEEMLPRKATSQKAYQQAKATYQVTVQQRRTAQAGLGQAKANLAQAQANLAEAKANLGAVDNENPQPLQRKPHSSRPSSTSSSPRCWHPSTVTSQISCSVSGARWWPISRRSRWSM